jgi:hypothetical protein
LEGKGVFDAIFSGTVKALPLIHHQKFEKSMKKPVGTRI